MSTVTRELLVANRLGLHLRAAAKVVQLTSKFESTIFLQSESVRINAKSIMNIAMLAASVGSTVLLEAEGSDAKEAADALEKLFKNKFGEE